MHGDRSATEMDLRILGHRRRLMILVYDECAAENDGGFVDVVMLITVFAEPKVVNRLAVASGEERKAKGLMR